MECYLTFDLSLSCSATEWLPKTDCANFESFDLSLWIEIASFILHIFTWKST